MFNNYKNVLISICIATYKRPKELHRLLIGLNQLTFTRIERPEIEVIVVNNDAKLSGRDFIDEEIKLQFRWKLKTDIEPKKGITFARNKTVSLVSADADFIAILDDDEVPEPSWLEELLLVQHQYNSDIVTGPAIPCLEDDEVPQWIIDGKFFAHTRFPTGQTRKVAYTNNVLLLAEALRNFKPVFNNRLATLGGEDCFLFLSLYKAGYKITWADEAIVYDYISSDRTNLKWILWRSYREPSSYSSAEKELFPSLLFQTLRATEGFVLIAVGLIRIIPTLLFGKAAIVRSLVYICRGLGTLGGLVGLFYPEYKNVDNQLVEE